MVRMREVYSKDIENHPWGRVSDAARLARLMMKALWHFQEVTEEERFELNELLQPLKWRIGSRGKLQRLGDEE